MNKIPFLTNQHTYLIPYGYTISAFCEVTYKGKPVFKDVQICLN
jgi:hypothetical protein